MSGLIVACARAGTGLPWSAAHLRRCAARLSPDHITPHEPIVRGDDRLAVVIVNPMPDLPAAPHAACVGALVGPATTWHAVGTARPDGTYALCRWDADRLELVTDNLGTRSIWYVARGDVMLASTSQRALVSLLGDFHLNDDAVAWLASSGTLGPDAAWDTRLRRVPAAAVWSLDRRDWITHCTAEDLTSAPRAMSDEVHLQRWREAILETCRKIDVSLDSWVLPLSGGLDSRTMLAALVHEGRPPRAVTWGLRRSLDDPRSDAVIATRLAAHYGVDHTFIAVDPDGVSAREVVDRFLLAGEGRTDQITGYLDGLRTWKSFFEGGVTGVLRGDEPGWGYGAVHSETSALRGTHLVTVEDYPQSHLIRQLGLAPQTLPDWAHRRPTESLLLLSSRLYRTHTYQMDLAPLNDIKCAYVEVLNPFLTDRVVAVARELPEALRAHRRGLKTVASRLGPPIPVAKRSAMASSQQLLCCWTDLLDEIVADLSSEDARRVGERRGLESVAAALSSPGAAPTRRRARSGVRAVVPRRLRVLLRPEPALTLPTFTLALRLHFASRMAGILTADAGSLGVGGRPRPGMNG